MQIRTTGQVHNGYPTGDVDCEGPEPCRETGSHGPVRAVLDHFQAEGTPERGLSLQARKSLIILNHRHISSRDSSTSQSPVEN